MWYRQTGSLSEGIDGPQIDGKVDPHYRCIGNHFCLQYLDLFGGHYTPRHEAHHDWSCLHGETQSYMSRFFDRNLTHPWNDSMCVLCGLCSTSHYRQKPKRQTKRPNNASPHDQSVFHLSRLLLQLHVTTSHLGTPIACQQ